MKQRSALVVMTLALMSVALVASAGPRRHHHRPNPRPAPTECPTECGVKLEHGPWDFNGEQNVTGVCIRSGNELTSLTADGTSGRFVVTGIGTRHVVVRHARGNGAAFWPFIQSVTFYHDCSTSPGGGGGNMPG